MTGGLNIDNSSEMNQRLASAKFVENSTEIYDIKQDFWFYSHTQLNTARTGHSMCVLGESFIFVFYGFD